MTVFVRLDDYRFYVVPLNQVDRLFKSTEVTSVINFSELPKDVADKIASFEILDLSKVQLGEKVERRRKLVTSKIVLSPTVNFIPTDIAHEIRQIIFELGRNVPCVPSQIVLSYYIPGTCPYMWITLRDDLYRLVNPMMVWVKEEVNGILTYGHSSESIQGTHLPSSSVISHWNFHLRYQEPALLLHYHPYWLVNKRRKSVTQALQNAYVIPSGVNSRSARFGCMLSLAMKNHEFVFQEGHGVWVCGKDAEDLSTRASHLEKRA